MNKILFSLLFLTLTAWGQDSAFTDVRDGKKYKAVKIGKQTWMAENLNYNLFSVRCLKD